MNCAIVLEARFERTPDGAVWTKAPQVAWEQYLSVFDGVRVVARLIDVEQPSAGAARAGTAGVTFAEIPHYIGPREYLARARQVVRAARSAIGPADAVTMNVPCSLAAAVEPVLRGGRRPYAVEVVGDPADVFAPGAYPHALRPVLRWWFTRGQRRQCAGAAAVSYVTEKMLQRRYPPGPGAYAVPCSDVQLPDAAFAAGPRTSRPAEITLVMVGSLAQIYKAPDVLIDAVALCRREGLPLRLSLVGDGRCRPELEARAAALGIAEHVTFRGQVARGEAVRRELDAADLFVLPSRTEGLPRAMIEAMARALPCIGSTVGGIPELLPAEEMVPPGDAAALARKIRDVATDPERMARMSARNLKKARAYHQAALSARRVAFYRYLRERTEEWKH